MKVFSFEKLKVWQKVRELSVLIYNTTKSFPHIEKFGLISQMRRCAVSISSNIAEGTGRHPSKDKARFTEIAFSFSLELYSRHLGFRIFIFFFSLFSSLKFTTVAEAMLENLCLDKRKNKYVKFSENLNILRILNQSILSNDLEFLLDKIYKEIRIRLTEIRVILEPIQIRNKLTTNTLIC